MSWMVLSGEAVDTKMRIALSAYEIQLKKLFGELVGKTLFASTQGMQGPDKLWKLEAFVKAAPEKLQQELLEAHAMEQASKS